jgi:hypothetical protein
MRQTYAFIRVHFSLPEVQNIGSTSNCGCDFPHVILTRGEWIGYSEVEVDDPEWEASERFNREARVALLQGCGEETVELYGVWLYERCDGPGLREAAVGADRAHQDRGDRAGLDLGEGASGRHGGIKNNGPQAIGKSRGGWNTKIHLVAADARTAITFALSPGHAHDAPEGRELLRELGTMPEGLPLLMDRAYEGNETRQLVLALGNGPGGAAQLGLFPHAQVSAK